MTPQILFIAPLLVAAVTLLLCLNARGICEQLGIMDVPNERKRHRNATPLMGGVALQVAFLPIAAALVLTIAPPALIQSLLIWLISIVAMTLVGIADDRHSLSARNRLLMSFLVFGSAAILDPLFTVRVLNFEHFGFELGLGTTWLAIIFTTICCVGLVNAVNMADGKNGLVIGLCLGWLGLLAFRAPPSLLPFIFILAAMLIILLIFNM
ncbi:MAG: hypothetical protein ACKVOJ_13625, partial [Sphingomonadaceae bacterium]